MPSSWRIAYIYDPFGYSKRAEHSVPTLKSLVLTRQGNGYNVLNSDWIDDLDEEQHKLIVNTPNLEYLNLTDWEADEFSLENLSSLLEACIDVGASSSGTISSSNILELLQAIANVKSLKFSALDINDSVLPTFPTFHNLTLLRLQDGSAGWNVDLLNVFLEYSPNLEVLVVEGNGLSDSGRLWSPPLRVPGCLLLNLKEIEYLNFGGGKQEFEVIEYMLKSAEVLKNMTIECQHLDSWRY